MSAPQLPRRPSGEPSFPERVGRYEILLPIASGGMATVYLARVHGPGGFEREVALKLVHAHLRGDPFFSLELLNEANLAARIRHPNVVPVLEVGEDPFGVFLVMDYIEGDTLAGLVRRGGPLPPRIGARILTDALAGLHAAHELTDGHDTLLGLVHRDFSPQNVLVGTDGMTRLADFGVAKAASRLGHTATGVMKGKIAYMAPEQARGMAIDRRCDVWAAGVVAWEVVAGRKLYPREDEVATLLKVISEDPPRLGQVVAGVAPELEEAVATALHRSVEGRHRTAAGFRAALAAAFRSGAGIADTDEVAAYAIDLLASQISTRRSRVDQVLTLRERLRDAAPSSGAPVTMGEVTMGETPKPLVQPAAAPPPGPAAALAAVPSAAEAPAGPPSVTSTAATLPAAVVSVGRPSSPAAAPPASGLHRGTLRLATAALTLAAMGVIAARWATLRQEVDPARSGAPAMTPSPLASGAAPPPASSSTSTASSAPAAAASALDAVGSATSATDPGTLASASAAPSAGKPFHDGAASGPKPRAPPEPSRGASLPPKRAAKQKCAPVTIDPAGKKHYHLECMDDGT